MSRFLFFLHLTALATTFSLFCADAADSPQVVQQNQFIFESAPFKSCHASTIAESKQGLVAAWFGGTAESKPDVGIWLSRLTNGKWTEPVEVANGVESAEVRYACWNPVLFQTDSSPLFLFYKVGLNPRTWWGMVMTSDDGGVTWSKPKRLPDGIVGPIKNKTVKLPSGEFLSPSSSEDAGWRVHFERSTDGGSTWTATNAINDGKEISAIQPSILIHKDGTLQAIGRTRQKRLFQTFSTDRGLTWSPMTLATLPNPNSGTDAVTLSDGRHLLIYNHVEKGRSPLNVAISADGKDWQAGLVLESQPGEYSYPAVIQSRDGLVHFTYTWKRERIRHVVIDPKRLTPKPLVEGRWPESDG